MPNESRPSDRHDGQEAQLGADAPHALDGADLIASADGEWHSLSLLAGKQDDERNYHSRKVIVALHRLCLFFDTNKEPLRSFVRSRGAFSNRRDDLSSIVAMGIIDRINPGKARSSIHYYAQACKVLRRKEVHPDNAMEWLAQPVYDESGGKGLTGLSKTIYLWSLEPEGVEAREKKEPHRRKLAAAPIRHLLGSDYGVFGKDDVAADLTNLLEGEPVLVMAQIVEGKPVLRNLLTTDPVLMAPVVRQCLKTRAKHIRRKI